MNEGFHKTVEEGLASLPGPAGEWFITLFEHGSLDVELYAPRGIDDQSPHLRDEVYIVVSGKGYFVNGPHRHSFGPGDFLFVPAGVIHRFEDFSDDLLVWVLFYGPTGGENHQTTEENASIEIERKFVVSTLPDLTPYASVFIRQGYLQSDTTGEVRLRQLGDDFWQTFKVGQPPRRHESSLSLTRAQFLSLWPLTEGQRVYKRRYFVPFSDWRIEVDIYQESLEGLVIAEVEFQSISDSQRFTPPAWIGTEVTQNKGFSNYSLAINQRIPAL